MCEKMMHSTLKRFLTNLNHNPLQNLETFYELTNGTVLNGLTHSDLVCMTSYFYLLFAKIRHD